MFRTPSPRKYCAASAQKGATCRQCWRTSSIVTSVETVNGPFLFGDKATPAEYAAGIDRAISLGWLEIHESGTFVKLTQSGADLFA